MSETCYDRFVYAFRLAIGPGVKCSLRHLFHPQKDSYCRKKLRHKLQSIVKQQIDLNLVWDDPFFHKICPCFHCGYCSDLYGFDQFCISVRQENYVINCHTSSWVTAQVCPSPKILASQRLEPDAIFSDDYFSLLVLPMTYIQLPFCTHN